ncbi:aminomethyltransferase family protein [Sinirhodobacter sp. WL0062]|uniref:Aminomethyltransferase family protein n=1 Tax=Rhodobacter flavimaris TaxID=2907145 RepID=A0ABS8YYY3_9RHOB|nr:aminomethyltransferase family protein [Sinirhodobacter sp. WL0062]MCE5975009.1 aminomethyltransferase family protein [Sinirhodobacter sp. WL0062]
MLPLPPDTLFRPGPPQPTRARRAEAFGRANALERYSVPGAGAVVVQIKPGDRIEIANDEGGQRCEVLAAHPDGRLDAGLLGWQADGPAAGLRALLTSREPSLDALRARLAALGIALADARAIGLFGATSRAGEAVGFTAQGEGWIIVAAPGTPMDFEAQDTATPLTLRITRATPRVTGGFALPDPLADPVLELRVKSATAEAYVVRAGEYIQILDVDGRQCTDFQCFDARKVDRGIFNPLDVTTTRTLMGHNYPMPGLHAKYYDQDFTALVEVIQDTCGRHDTFGLACASKYYDDIGYPGHANCSDNFNRALDPYGIPGRAGWMAANFFFNTGIDAHGVVYADEPWSRPGDYVLMRALTDLVCVSSACPDDTSAANGWHLTDIHVRSYAATERFQRASAWRATPDAEPIMTRQSAFYENFAALTQDFVEYKGFWLPNSFAQTDPVESYFACREGVVVMDLSALRKFEVTGPDAEALMNWVLTRDVTKLGHGQIVYSAMCYPHGGMIDDGTLFRLGPQNFRWIGGSDEGGVWMREEAERLGLNVMIRSSTDQMHNLAVQGPKSRELMGQIVWTPRHQPAIPDLGWFRFTVGRLGGPEGAPIVVSRTGYTGELGYEIFCHPKDGAQVFEAIWAAGQPLGIKPMGLAGLDLVRIEAGLVFAGYDFSDQTDPFEAGVGFTVPLKSKTADFVGREALIRRKETPARKFVGLEIEGQDPVGHGDCIRIGRAQVGEICSAMRSPRTNTLIALARIDVAHAEPGTAVEVGRLDGHIKRIAARVTSFPHYDPKKERPRS